MNGTLASYIDLLTPWIPTELISPPYLHHIRRISQRLPALSFGCFECWLAAEEPRVDFNVAIAGKLNEHRTVADWVARLPQPDAEAQTSALRNLQTICSTWSSPGFFLSSHIRILWLVYDIVNPLSVVSVPWLYVHFRENQFMNDAVVRPEIILQTLALIANRPISAKTGAIRAFLESIPSRIQIRAVGLPSNRGDNLLRIYLVMQTYADLQRFITEHAWPGDVNALEQQMSPLIHHCDFFALLIDVNPAIQPKIGIECWFNDAQTQDKLISFTNRLLEAGLCSSQKQAALLRWNGRFETKTSPLLWSSPDSIPHTTTEPQRVVIRKMAQYVKLVYEPGKPVVAKGYLYFDRLLKGG
ncbi:hypothetical protein HNV11_12365 [Spirosoma taeanense]|uniref:Uncharacterized protein n=1 Tax=Spirosoma taeanense TaxID=2735870 RepID=A0A6M5YA87_9BACT|nr:hypothetical protein [Spirosoma taeanense]QJW90113.1 hypothetical protein HNV11_12365 [Spirosoma taeanense]